MTGPTVLLAENLSVHRGRRQVVGGIDLQVRPGEVVAILGPNGAGKSTLLSAIGGLLPATGRLEVTGRVATVMQTPGLARRSVRANLDLAQAWWGVPRAERRDRTVAALAGLGIADLATRQAATLSGGQARRVHLARGLAVRGDLLLLDEPFAGLDPQSHAALVTDLSGAMRGEPAVLIVLHDRADAWALADRIAVMMDGRIVADAAPDALLAAPPSARVASFLGYDGRLDLPGGSLLTRPEHVVITDSGDLTATVVRATRLLDGVSLELTTDHGRVTAVDRTGLARAGDVVRVRVVGGVRFGS